MNVTHGASQLGVRGRGRNGIGVRLEVLTADRKRRTNRPERLEEPFGRICVSFERFDDRVETLIHQLGEGGRDQQILEAEE